MLLCFDDAVALEARVDLRDCGGYATVVVMLPREAATGVPKFKEIAHVLDLSLGAQGSDSFVVLLGVQQRAAYCSKAPRAGWLWLGAEQAAYGRDRTTQQTQSATRTRRFQSSKNVQL